MTLEYTPSSLDTQEEAELTFENPEVGLWIYRAKGVGLPPKEPRKVSVVSQVRSRPGMEGRTGRVRREQSLRMNELAN